MSNTLTASVVGYVPVCTPDRPTCDNHRLMPPADPLVHSLVWNRMVTYHAWIDPERRGAFRRREEWFRNTQNALTGKEKGEGR